MRVTGLRLLLLLIFGCVFSTAAPLPPCVGGHLDQYIGGPPCVFGDLTFSNFEYQTSGSVPGPPPSEIPIWFSFDSQVFGYPVPMVWLNVHSSLFSAFGVASTDVSISYDVEVAPGLYVDSIVLWGFTGSDGITASAGLSLESPCGLGGWDVVVAVCSPPNPSAFTVRDRVAVWTYELCPGCIADFAFAQLNGNAFRVVPEPASFIMLGSGIFALAGRRQIRRRPPLQ
jgi:hypothetical protein